MQEVAFKHSRQVLACVGFLKQQGGLAHQEELLAAIRPFHASQSAALLVPGSYAEATGRRQHTVGEASDPVQKAAAWGPPQFPRLAERQSRYSQAELH